MLMSLKVEIVRLESWRPSQSGIGASRLALFGFTGLAGALRSVSKKQIRNIAQVSLHIDYRTVLLFDTI